MDRTGWPIAGRRQVVGLLGGSFDPAHEGHAHITREAIKRFGLDHVWWLVSPGNPLKSRGPAPLDQRIAGAKVVMDHPRVDVTGIEADLGTRFTAQTLARLMEIYPNVQFVWLMGADNLAQFHRWQDWRWIMDTVPIGVIARPGDRISARMGTAAKIYRGAKISGRAAKTLARQTAPAWCFVNAPMSAQSSTAIRQQERAKAARD
jgi:nicotinate-nucleotide adenylyltransferase